MLDKSGPSFATTIRETAVLRPSVLAEAAPGARSAAATLKVCLYCSGQHQSPGSKNVFEGRYDLLKRLIKRSFKLDDETRGLRLPAHQVPRGPISLLDQVR